MQKKSHLIGLMVQSGEAVELVQPANIKYLKFYMILACSTVYFVNYALDILLPD